MKKQRNRTYLRGWRSLALILNSLSMAARGQTDVLDGAIWQLAQAQYDYNQAQSIGFKNAVGSTTSTGATLFPVETALTSPNGCIHYGGTPAGGANGIDHETTMTEYVARLKLADGTSTWGKAVSDDCGPCNNTCPCPTADGRAFGWFPQHTLQQYGMSRHYGLEVSPAVYNNNVSTPYTTFDILLQPSSPEDLQYSWAPLSEAAANPAAAFLNGDFAPCCIPLSQADMDVIFDDNALSNTTGHTWPWQDADWRPGGANISGHMMGVCNLANYTSVFTWYSFAYEHIPDEGEIDEPLVLMINRTALTHAPALVQEGPSVNLRAVDADQNAADVTSFSAPWVSVLDNYTVLQEADLLPMGCQLQLTPDVNDSLVVPMPEWYAAADAIWGVAAVQGRITEDAAGDIITAYPFSVGRAHAWGNESSGSQLARGWFPFNGSEETNATTLSSPSRFYILAPTGSMIIDNHEHVYSWGDASAPSNATRYIMEVAGVVPCCIASTIPAVNDSQLPVGDVLGWCNPAAGAAQITWLGQIVDQELADARLLTLDIIPLPGPDRTPAIIGGVVAGVVVILLVAGLIGMMMWSKRSYRFRAYKRLIEDHVHGMVLGARGKLPNSSKDSDLSDRSTQVANDRFFNLLPFVNRMPRNQFYANLASSVAHGCLRSWTNLRGTQPQAGSCGVLDSRFDGRAAQALAYAILKYETLWSATDRAIVQQWPKGRRSRRLLIMGIEDILASKEVTDFMAALEPDALHADTIGSKGLWTMLARLLCCVLPARRISKEDHAIKSSGLSGNERALLEDVASSCTMTSSSAYPSSYSDPEGYKHPADAMSNILRELQLDDWEIRPSEIEIVKHEDGRPVILGQGAFGCVYMAKWNGVQTVAVKKLLQATSDKAKIDFLREVSILKKLKAENVVRFLGVCVQDENTMLVTEFMQGGDLYKGISSDTRSEQFRWYNMGKRIALDVARGLVLIHSQKIVHFDIKSPNILLARDLTAKIADVGLAKIMRREHFTNVSVLGTMAWTAPELLQGARDISAKADIYSLGVLLFEIVCQETPKFGQQWYRSPRAPEECPQWCAQLMEDCMEADAAKRPTSKEVYQRLLAGGESV